MSLYPVINQFVYPGVGPKPYDDCAVIATFWASRAAGYAGSLPTVEAFREAAGNPDDPTVSDGLTNAQVWAGVRGTALRHLSPVRWDAWGAGDDWSGFAALLRTGCMASLAVLSSKLPANLRFGFLGGHRIGVAFDGGRFVVANPLAPQGSAPLPISEAELREAALSWGGGTVEAVLFPPLEASDMLAVTDSAPDPRTVDIPVGKQLFDLAGNPLREVSTKQNDVFSPFRGGPDGAYRAVVLVTGGQRQLVLVRRIDVDDSRPLLGDVKKTVTVTVSDGRPPLKLEV